MARASAAAGDAPTALRKASPRKPSRERGHMRYAALLDATEALLQHHSPDDIGLYQIAERAAVPPASVYHFFPTKDAAFLALAERYLAGFRELALRPIPATALASWQALTLFDQRQAMEFYNSHPAALKIFYGGYAGLEVRQADVRYTATVADGVYGRLDRVFHMPMMRTPGSKFRIALAIIDAIWGISYLTHGHITEAFFTEAYDAYCNYCRQFLPAVVEVRDAYLDAAANGGTVSLYNRTS